MIAERSRASSSRTSAAPSAAPASGSPDWSGTHENGATHDGRAATARGVADADAAIHAVRAAGRCLQGGAGGRRTRPGPQDHDERDGGDTLTPRKPELWGAAELCAAFGVSRQTLSKWRKR